MATPTLPELIPLSDAVLKTHLPEKTLRTMLQTGKIMGGKLNGVIFVNEKTLPFTRKEDLPEYKKHAYLRGKAIWISEAARKHKIPQPTISRWLKSGVIVKMDMDGNKILVDEADIAYCAEIYHNRKTKQGRRLFDDRGMPYKPKTRPLSM